MARRYGALVLVVVGVMWLSSAAMVPHAQNGATPTPTGSFAGKLPAPEFAQGLDWINVDAPLTLAALRGKVVLLDFWTYGCINCIHILPDLKRLEAEFSNELAIVGVHSAKFSNEGNSDNLRAIVESYGITHPVVNDNAYAIWKTYGVRAWPTLVLIDPQGQVYAYHEGEGVYAAVQPTIQGMIAQFDAQKLIDRTPLKTAPIAAKATALSFPAKVLADAAGQRLFISDTGHNRIVVADLNTFAIQAVIGGGTPGLKDGDFATAQFNWPHGMALNSDILYVADTGNHAIRAIDLKGGTVSTLAGTGQQRSDPGIVQASLLPTTALNSPWDLAYVADLDKLYITMAGAHQIWVLNIQTQRIETYVGSGVEGLIDDKRLDARLAQPSGIVEDDGWLYFTDSESSAVRRVRIAEYGEVKTLIGAGLFLFGDIDGGIKLARLQHPQGLTVVDGALYVADTYNSKIKRIMPDARTSEALFGGGRGAADGTGLNAQFWEPGGISSANGKLYVADTNNHAIRLVDLTTNEVKTITFLNEDVLLPQAKAEPIEQPPSDFFGEVVKAPAVSAAPGNGTIVLNIILPDGYKFNDQAPFRLKFYNTSPVAQVEAANNNLKIIAPAMPLRVPVTLREGNAPITVDTDIFYCEAKQESLCFPISVRFEIPLTVQDGGQAEIPLSYTIVPPVSK